VVAAGDVDLQGAQPHADRVRGRPLPRADIHNLAALKRQAVPLQVGGDRRHLQIDAAGGLGVGVAQPWGEVLNEFCDRLADVALFVGLSSARGSTPWLDIVATILMLLSSYLGTASKAAGGTRQYGGVMGKADRMIYLAVVSVPAALLPIYTLFLALVCCGLCVTIVQRLRVTYAELQSPR